jgi:agmatine deiminase
MTRAEGAAAGRSGAHSMRRMPAEWERHEATWIAWPHHEPDWPGKLAAIPPVYGEIVRALAPHERIEILCNDERIEAEARQVLDANGVAKSGYRLHCLPTDRVWLRDSAPTGAFRDDGIRELVNWDFNGWAKYDNYANDVKVGAAIERITGLARIEPLRPDGRRLVLEGGGIEVNGAGKLLVTEEWLLSDVQVRNPGMSRADYERAFRDFLGVNETIWLGEGCVGDDTHGHIDDVARFSSPDTVLLAHEEDPADENHRRSLDNLNRLKRHRSLRVVTLPYPQPVMMNGERLPASYANFYIANGIVIVPTFDDPADRVALDIIASEFPGRIIAGINAVDLVWGLGTLHCLSQQQPASPA